jgi:hypothetical protein
MRTKKKSDVSGMTREQYIEYIRNLPADACKGRCEAVRRTVIKPASSAPPAEADADLEKIRAMLYQVKHGDDLYAEFLATSLNGQNGRRK